MWGNRMIIVAPRPFFSLFVHSRIPRLDPNEATHCLFSPSSLEAKQILDAQSDKKLLLHSRMELSICPGNASVAKGGGDRRCEIYV